MNVQAILFRHPPWAPPEAKLWLIAHEFHPIKKVHVTDHWLRYRLKQPMQHKEYRTIKLNKNIMAVLEL